MKNLTTSSNNKNRQSEEIVKGLVKLQLITLLKQANSDYRLFFLKINQLESKEKILKRKLTERISKKERVEISKELKMIKQEKEKAFSRFEEIIGYIEEIHELLDCKD